MHAYLLHSNKNSIKLLLDRMNISHGTHLPMDAHFEVIIQWNHVLKDTSEGILLNRKQAVERCQDREAMSSLLRLHGIHYLRSEKKERLKFIHEFQVPVFHLNALTILKKEESSAYTSPLIQTRESAVFKDVGIGMKSWHERRAARLAVRAVYLAHLDFAVVQIGILANGNLMITHMHPTPLLNERLADLYVDAIQEYMHEYEKEVARGQSVLIGCDPEFILCNAFGQVASASKFMGKEGKVGCDAIVLRRDHVIYPLVELRPEPSRDPYQLQKNIHQTMHLAAQLVTDERLEWLAGGMPKKGFALGGHIHFSRLWLNSHLLRVFDNYLALPWMLLEDDTAISRRPRYGVFGDFRRKKHGGFEYRTLSSWLVTPKITLAVLTLTKLLVDHYPQLRHFPLLDTQIVEQFYNGNQKKLKQIVFKQWNEIKMLTDFSKFKKELQPIEDMFRKGMRWNEQKDIRMEWQISPYTENQANREVFHDII